MSDGIGNRLEKVRGKTSIKKFGEEYGAAPNTVRSYEKGESSPPIDYLMRICSGGRKIPQEWLILGQGEPPEWLSHGVGDLAEIHQVLSDDDRPEPLENNAVYIDENGLLAVPILKTPSIEDFCFLPLVETRLSAGAGSFVLSEAVETYYAYRKTFINRYATSQKNVILAYATGNSMEGTLYDGDIVMIDTGRRTIEDGRIFAIRLGEVIAIKRLSLLPNDKAMVISDNKEEYAPYEANIEDIHVIGKMMISSHVHV